VTAGCRCCTFQASGWGPQHLQHKWPHCWLSVKVFFSDVLGNGWTQAVSRRVCSLCQQKHAVRASIHDCMSTGAVDKQQYDLYVHQMQRIG
jgi:hypothetical protein